MRHFQEYFYDPPKKGRFVSLTYLKNNKMILFNVEENIWERLNQQYKNTTEVLDMEQKFIKLSQNLEKNDDSNFDKNKPTPTEQMD